MKIYAAIPVLLALSACAPPPPANPMERYARMAGAAKVASDSCAGYAGGYEGTRRMRADANKHITAARNLGATDEVINEQTKVVRDAFNTMVAFTTRQEACNELIGRLAWESS